MSTRYLAFVRVGAALHVLGSPDGTAAALRPLGVFTPDWPAVHEAADTIAAWTRHAAEAGEFTSSALEDLRVRAEFLFDELLPFEAKRWLAAERGVLTLSLDPVLLDLPWELLHDGETFISLRWAMGRVVQSTTEDLPRRPIADGGPRPMLVVADPDDGLLAAYDEGMALRADLLEADDVALTFRAADVDAGFLRRHLRGYDLVHFAGHVDPAGWRMSESIFDVAALERLRGGGPLPALVFANGCGGAKADPYEGSLLEAWISGGVRHYLAPLFDLPDRLGRDFGTQFYAQLRTGIPVGEAVRRARRALARNIGEATVPWGAYVLYGDPDAVYFPLEAPAEVPPPEARPNRSSTRLSRGTSAEPEALRQAGAVSAGSASPRPTSLRWQNAAFWLLLALIAALAGFAAFGWPAETGAFAGPEWHPSATP